METWRVQVFRVSENLEAKEMKNYTPFLRSLEREPDHKMYDT